MSSITFASPPALQPGQELSWWVEQRGELLLPKDHALTLRREPFTIVFHVRWETNFDVFVNAALSPQSLQAASAGRPFTHIRGFRQLQQPHRGIGTHAVDNPSREIWIFTDGPDQWSPCLIDEPRCADFDAPCTEVSGGLLCRRTIEHISETIVESDRTVERWLTVGETTAPALFLVFFLPGEVHDGAVLETKERARDWVTLRWITESRNSTPDHATIDVATPTTLAGLLAGICPVPNLVPGCPATLERRLRPSEVPVLDAKPVLSPLLEAGAAGTPKRVRMRFHNPIAYCDCPNFALTDYGLQPKEKYHGVTALDWLHVVFPNGMPNGNAYVFGKYQGFTQYELTGYFSGRLVDIYGNSVVDYDTQGHPIGGEAELGWQDLYVEFCVEDWCYHPDPDPVRYKQVKSAEEVTADRAEYAGILAEMRRAGAKLCSTRRPAGE